MITELLPSLSLASTDRDHHRVVVLDSQSQFDDIEEQVCWRMAENLRGALPAYLPTSDNDLGDDDQTATQPRKTPTKVFQGSCGWHTTQSSHR